MKAAFFRPGGNFEVSDCPTPQPGPGEALVKVAYCGICGSDVSFIKAGMLPSGCIIGHELSGQVEAVGDGVEGWSEGDRVAVMPIDPCFSCVPCKSGNTQLCSDGLKRSYGLGGRPGGFAEYMLVKSSMLFKIPESVDMKTAAINEPWAVALHGAAMLGLTENSLALVMGAGPIGIMSVFALKCAGVTDIYVSEPDEYRRSMAAKAGAKEVIEARPGSIIHKNEGRSPDCVIDAVGIESSAQEAISYVGSRGKVLILGVHMGIAGIMPLVCFAKEVQLNFSLGYTEVEFGESLLLLEKGKVDAEVAISDVMPLGEIAAAFGMLKESGHEKVLIDCQAI